MAEPDAVADLEKTAKQLVSEIWGIFKSQLEKQRQAEEQKRGQEISNQFAMEQQEKLLEGFRKIMQEQNPVAPQVATPPLGASQSVATQTQAPFSPAQTEALDDISRQEKGINESIEKIDDRLEKIDAEREKLLGPEVETPDIEKLRELQKESTQLKESRKQESEKLQELSEERAFVSQASLKDIGTGGQRPKVESEQPKVESEQPKVGSEQPKVGSEQPKVGSEQPKVEGAKLDPSKRETTKPELQQPKDQLAQAEKRLTEIQALQEFEKISPSGEQAVEKLKTEQQQLEKQIKTLKEQELGPQQETEKTGVGLNDEGLKPEEPELDQEVDTQAEGIKDLDPEGTSVVNKPITQENSGMPPVGNVGKALETPPLKPEGQELGGISPGQIKVGNLGKPKEGLGSESQSPGIGMGQQGGSQRTWRSGSVGAQLNEQGYKLGKPPRLGVKQGTTIGRKGSM